MRVAIISDIHSNLEALNTAFSVIAVKNVDEIICLGDVVGYGPNPNECVEVVLKHTQHIILGNHDEAAVNLATAEYFNPYARIAAEWTNKELTQKNKELLRKLPYTIERHGLLFVHASPFQPELWYYIVSFSDAQKNFRYFTQPVCFVGHSHVPIIFSDDLWTPDVQRGGKYIINVGSIGQPRDHDPRLSFGVFDTETWQYENVRLEYDMKETARKIRIAGLPTILADRLFDGK
ncbi:MAG: metallophosphoesterase family protein [Ignavibacteriae bacterium]|nr:metallophosphoesterase family protein [Ignavibacteriota bacterium]